MVATAQDAPTREVFRSDFGRLGSAKRTGAGAVRVDASFTQAGVYPYKYGERTVMEWRPPEEVFQEDSIRSMDGIPVTYLHPKEGRVTPASSGRLAKGHVVDGASRQDAGVSGTVQIDDQGLMDRVSRGDGQEISMGYTCTMVDRAGVTPEGVRYDSVQTQIRYNHAAIGPRGWGRQGADSALKLDSAGESVLPLPEHGLMIDTKTIIKIHLDGKTFEEGSAAHLDHLTGKADQAEAARSEAQKKADQLEGKCDELTKELEALKAGPHLDELVRARSGLLDQARKVGGEDLKTDGLDDRQVMVLAMGDAARFDGKSDDYVAGVFSQAVTSSASTFDKTPVHVDKADKADKAGSELADKADSAAAHDNMTMRHTEAWKKPLRASTVTPTH